MEEIDDGCVLSGGNDGAELRRSTLSCPVWILDALAVLGRGKARSHAGPALL
jgi:hypothetical protein